MVAATGVFWSGYRRGTVTDAHWVLIVLTGLGTTYVLRLLPWLVRPLRWLTSLAAVLVLIAVLLFLLKTIN